MANREQLDIALSSINTDEEHVKDILDTGYKSQPSSPKCYKCIGEFTTAHTSVTRCS